MSERIFSYDAAFAAMCIMEEIADPQLPDAPTPWDDYREQWGINGLRSIILSNLADACDAAWTKAGDRYDAMLEEYERSIAENGDGSTHLERPSDPGSFDYDFVPFWLRECVDWSNTAAAGGPRVRGT